MFYDPKTRGSMFFDPKNAQIHVFRPVNSRIHVYRTKKQDGANFSKVVVPAKITLVKKEYLDDVVPKISEYANTQNIVKKADFSSNHQFHIAIKKLSQKISWYKLDCRKPSNLHSFWPTLNNVSLFLAFIKIIFSMSSITVLSNG